MVQSNELRIGNWLYVGNSPEPWKMQLDEDSMEVLMGARDYHNFSPIPLSAEILEKAGFKKDWNGYSLQNIRSVSFAITKDGELLACWLDRSLGFTVNYLHQLQNLYFALTGEELPVEL